MTVLAVTALILLTAALPVSAHYWGQALAHRPEGTR